MSKKSKNHLTHPPLRQRKSGSSGWLLLGGLVLVSAAVLVLVWFMLTPTRGSGGTPQLAVNTERLDFGKQIFGNTVHASFEVKNTGTGTLTLSVPSSVTVLEGC